MREIKLAVVGIVLLLSIIWAGLHFAAKHGGDANELKNAIEQTETGEKTLLRLDTVYVHDTIRLTKELAKWRTLRDSIVITDTVIVREALKQADSTIQACLETVQTCEQKDSAHRVVEEGLRRQNEALKNLVPGKIEKLVTATKWTLVGIGLGVVIGTRR